MKQIDMSSLDTGYIAERILAGEVFIYPTDTVYGIGCDCTNLKAVRRVKEIKGRDFKKPLSLAFPDTLISKASIFDDFVFLDPEKKEIMEEFLPGPYTFILGKKDKIPDEVTGGLPTVGVRIPEVDFLLDIIRRTGVPIVTTSANLSGEPPTNDFRRIDRKLLDEVDFAVNAGRFGTGIPSRVVDLTKKGKILR